MAGVTVSGRVLELAAKRNNFAVPDNELVFFGIRGALPEGSGSTEFRAEHLLEFVDVDYSHMRCTLGQWNRRDNTVALFPGSTVPSAFSIRKARKGGSPANRLLPGRYQHVKGPHKGGKPGGHRAFRQASFFPVQRTADNDSYDNFDAIDFGNGSGDYIWDNIHCAYHNDLNGFSSAGCQVVMGLPKSPARGMAREEGPWRTFIDNAYDLFATQNTFTYLLFTADEIGVVVNNDLSKIQQQLKFGSTGDLVKELQKALVAENLLTGTPDGDFGRKSLIALTDFQKRKFGQKGTDGVCGQNTAPALNLKLPSLTGAVLPPVSKVPPDPSDGTTTDLPDDSDLTPEELRDWLIILFGGTPESPLTPDQPGAGTQDPPPVVPKAGDHGNDDDKPGSIELTAADWEEISRRNFERAQDIIREYEGGFANHPHDPGGATNFGITHITLAAWRKVPKVSVLDVKNMSYNEAKDIYKAWYWDKNRCGELPGPVALAVYNIGIHCGTKTGGTYLQRALNKHGASLEVDGKIGKDTIAAMNLAPRAAVTENLIDLYNERLMGHPKIATFKAGFMNRVSKLRAETTKWLVELETTSPTSRPLPPPIIIDGLPPPLNQGDSTMNNSLEEILRKALAELSGALAAANAANAAKPLPIIPGTGTVPSTTPGLGPVNGALGETLGKLFNGKKSAVGIIGALLTSLLGNSDPTSIGGQLGAILTKALPIFAGSGGTMLPIFLAIAAWGVLGKMEKWSGAPK